MSDPTTIEKPQEAVASDPLFAVTCRVCGSRSVTWHCQPQNRGGVQDGRIKLNEVGVVFFLGCDECSETLKIVEGDRIAALLTKLHSANADVELPPRGGSETKKGVVGG